MNVYIIYVYIYICIYVYIRTYLHIYIYILRYISLAVDLGGPGFLLTSFHPRFEVESMFCTPKSLHSHVTGPRTPYSS